MQDSCFDTLDGIPSQITDAFLAEMRRGKTPNIAAYAKMLPERSEQVVDYLESLMFAETIRRKQQASGGEVITHVADYELESVLGRGAMGTVYLANDAKSNRKVAIKLLNKAQSASERARARFLREAEAVSRFTHPNIVPLYDYGSDAGRSYLVMKYINGRTLDEFLDHAALPVQRDPAVDLFGLSKVIGQDNSWPDQGASFIASDYSRIAAIGRDVACALSHAHQNEAIHRDIKPANLILDSSGRIWVTDFGLAKLQHDDSNLSRTGDIIGTPRYMAPEQIRGAADQRSDVYSLGITLYELVTGQPAWNAAECTTQQQLLQAKSEVQVPELRESKPDAPAQLAEIIMKACNVQPQLRYQTAEELRQALDEFGKQNPSSFSVPVKRPAKSKPIVRRNLLIAGLIAGVTSMAVFTNEPKVMPTHSETNDRLPAIAKASVVRLHNNQTTLGYIKLDDELGGRSLSWVLAGDDSTYFKIDPATGCVSVAEPVLFGSRSGADISDTFQLTASAIDSNTGHHMLRTDFLVQLVGTTVTGE